MGKPLMTIGVVGKGFNVHVPEEINISISFSLYI